MRFIIFSLLATASRAAISNQADDSMRGDLSRFAARELLVLRKMLLRYPHAAHLKEVNSLLKDLSGIWPTASEEVEADRRSGADVEKKGVEASQATGDLFSLGATDDDYARVEEKVKEAQAAEEEQQMEQMADVLDDPSKEIASLLKICRLQWNFLSPTKAEDSSLTLRATIRELLGPQGAERDFERLAILRAHEKLLTASNDVAGKMEIISAFYDKLKSEEVCQNETNETNPAILGDAKFSKLSLFGCCGSKRMSKARKAARRQKGSKRKNREQPSQTKRGRKSKQAAE